MAKKNLRKIPPAVLARIGAIAVDDVVVACAKHLTTKDIAGYADLGMRLEHGQLVLPGPAVPPEHRGKYSRANVAGRIRVRRDLQKIQKSFTTEAPDWHG